MYADRSDTKCFVLIVTWSVVGYAGRTNYVSGLVEITQGCGNRGFAKVVQNRRAWWHYRK